MSATNLYHNLPKLARVKLPSGTEYAVVDYNGRELIAPIFNTSSTYSIGDLVIYEDNLYRFVSAKPAGDWSPSPVVLTSVEAELDRLWGAVTGGIHYRGKTVTKIYDGSTTNPVYDGTGHAITAEAGDMVLLELAYTNTSEYETGIALAQNTYYYKGSGPYDWYICNTARTAEQNTD